jgi:hypothetical protein
VVAVLRTRNAITTEAPVLEALARRSSDVWEEYREQLDAHPDAIEFPQHFIDNRWTRVAVLGDDTPIGFSAVIPGSALPTKSTGCSSSPRRWQLASDER